ncbi:hypothetical protein SDC9_130682 [bioreactor metagenome]|uniref:Uncharacterized protein n=1 Tax=bioreactor metagenome TaxID=1076179 RepID=A0A645D3C9_9ZZZZ
MPVMPFAVGGNGLAVRHPRRRKIGLGFVLIFEFLAHHAQVLVAHARKQQFVGLSVPGQSHGRIALGNAVQSGCNLFILAGLDRGNRIGHDRMGKFDRGQRLDFGRGSQRLIEPGRFELGNRNHAAGTGFGHRRRILAVQQQQLADAFLALSRHIEDFTVGFEYAGKNPQKGQLSDKRVVQ